MALTREQFQELRAKGLSVQQIVAFESGSTPDNLKQEKQVAQQTEGNQFEDKGTQSPINARNERNRNVATKIIGGGKLAEGAGFALAASGVRKEIEQASQALSGAQEALIARIKEKKDKGEDVSRLQKALKDSVGANMALTDIQTDFVEALPSNKEVIGSSARLATTLASGAIGRGASKVTALSSATNFASGALRGAGAGALSGGIIGGLQGAGLGAEEDKDAKGIATSAAVGAGGGAVTGGVLGAALGGVSGHLRGKALAKEGFAEDLVAKQPSKKVNVEGAKRGQFQDPTFFEKAKITSTPRDKQLADSVRDVVSSKAKTGQNIDAIRLKISNTDKGVANYVGKNKVPFNTNQLKAQLNSGKADLDLVFTSDELAEKTYDGVVNKFLSQIKGKDTAGLLRARKDFDQLPAVEKLLNNDALGENTKREIVLAVRGAANKYVASLLPKGNTFRADLLQEHYMIEALSNVAEKAHRQVGKNKLQIITAEFPILKWIAAGLAGAGGVGIGGSIIGSTD
jgi:hypothetical protein